MVLKLGMWIWVVRWCVSGLYFYVMHVFDIDTFFAKLKLDRAGNLEKNGLVPSVIVNILN